jgi:hypothetical protein
MFQFSLKRLFLVMACIAALCGIVGDFIHSGDPKGPPGVLWLFDLIIQRPHCLAALGATIGAIFGRLGFWLGLGMGCAASTLVYLMFYVGSFC